MVCSAPRITLRSAETFPPLEAACPLPASTAVAAPAPALASHTSRMDFFIAISWPDDQLWNAACKFNVSQWLRGRQGAENTFGDQMTSTGLGFMRRRVPPFEIQPIRHQDSRGTRDRTAHKSMNIIEGSLAL